MTRLIAFLILLSGNVNVFSQSITEKLERAKVKYENGHVFLYGFAEGKLVVKKYDASLNLKAEYSKGLRTEVKEHGVMFGWEGKNIVIFVPYSNLLSDGLFVRLTEDLKEISVKEMSEADGKAERKRAGFSNLSLPTLYNDSFDVFVDDGQLTYHKINTGYPYWPRFEPIWKTSLEMGKTDESYTFPLFLCYGSERIVYYTNERVGKGYQQFVSAINMKGKAVEWRIPLNDAPNSVWSPSAGLILPSGKILMAGSYSQEDSKQKRITNSMGESFGLAHMTGGFLMKLDGSGKIAGTKTFKLSQSREGLPGKYETDMPLARVHSIKATSKGTYIALMEEFCFAGVSSTKDRLNEGFGGPENTFITLGFTQVEFNENLEILKTITTKRKELETGITKSPGTPPGPSTGMDCYKTVTYGRSYADNFGAVHGPTITHWTGETGESVIIYRNYFSAEKFELLVIQFSDGVAQAFELSTDEDFFNINNYSYWTYITGANSVVMCKLGKNEVVLTRKGF